MNAEAGLNRKCESAKHSILGGDTVLSILFSDHREDAFCFQIRNGIDFDVSSAIEQLCCPGLNRQVKISGPDLALGLENFQTFR